jgi:hypothetical protein
MGFAVSQIQPNLILRGLSKSMGAIVLVKVSLALGLSVWEQWFMKPLNLVKRYGRDSWAVITGGSDRIGLAMDEK